MHKLVLIRHGQSQWNKENRFTGWVDVELSEAGRSEAEAASKLLQSAGFKFDVAYTSLLKRAIDTLWITLKGMDQMWVPVNKSWRLNERHYGSLQGLNKSETSKKFGEEQVFTWRRSFSTPPPELDTKDPSHPVHDRRYQGLADELPNSEALSHCRNRVLPYWQQDIAPAIESGKTVLVAAHGNSLRALVMMLDNISEEDIASLNIPTGIPLVYELDDKLKPMNSYYLGDENEAKRKAEAVAHQAKE